MSDFHTRKKERVLVQLVGNDDWYLGRVASVRDRKIQVLAGPMTGFIAPSRDIFAWKRLP